MKVANTNYPSIPNRKHPDYDRLTPHWDFLEETYVGGREWFVGNIFKYLKEGDTEFTKRLERAYRFNHTREVVDLVTKYLFKSDIVRNTEIASDVVKYFWKHPGREQSPGGIDQFMRNLATQASIYGRVYVVVDSTHSGSISVGDEIRSKDEQLYAYVVQPQRVRDMSFDETGALRWVIIEETYRDDEDPFASTGDVLKRYRLWTRESWLLFGDISSADLSSQSQPIDGGDHNLGVVPVIPVDHIINDESPYSSPSMIGDVAYLDRAVANYLSNLDAIIQDQTFSQLVIPVEALANGTDGDDGDTERQIVKMGINRVFTYYSGDGAAAPHFISPDVKQANLILATIGKVINEIYHSVGVAGERTKEDNAMGIDNSSGVAKAYDFDRINSLLTSKGASLQAAENRIVELVERWNGNDDFESELVRYPETFDTRGIKDEFEIAMSLRLVDAPELMRRHQMATLIEKLFPHLSQSDRAELEKSLKDWPVDVMDTAGPVNRAALVDGTKVSQQGQNNAPDKGEA